MLRRSFDLLSGRFWKRSTEILQTSAEENTRPVEDFFMGLQMKGPQWPANAVSVPSQFSVEGVDWKSLLHTRSLEHLGTNSWFNNV